MGDFFRERTAALKLEVEVHRDFRRRFYHDECFWDSRRGTIETNEAEKIIDALPSDIGKDVITTGSTIYRSRYQVKSSGESWLIHVVELECGVCRIKGTAADCVICGGKGWLNENDRSVLLERQRAAQTASLTSDEVSGNRLFHNEAIEQFMTTHFSERTASLKNEVKIHTAYWNRFYSPDCSWNRKHETIQWSEAEKIVSMAQSDAEIHVITRGFAWHRLRYHLRSTEQSWLIWEADIECPRCTRYGNSADCNLCGGTLWTSGKRMSRRARNKSPGEEPPPESPRWQP